MLLDFSFENFRSFCNMSTLNMTPADIRDIPYSILSEKIDKNKYRALSSSVIYGANASGKSNSILALSFLREIVICGNLKNQRILPIALIPCFCSEKKSNTIDFSIKFSHDKSVFNYKLKIGGVKFFSEELNPFVDYEELSINEKIVFIRLKNEISLCQKMATSNVKDINNLIQEQATNSLLPDELFLTNGYKTLISTEYYSSIINWFKYHLIIINNVNYVESAPRTDFDRIEDNPETEIKLSDEIINDIAFSAGIDSTKIRFIKTNKDKTPKPVSFINGKGVISRFIESNGTMKIINFLPLVITVMKHGSTLVVDELDSSLHPSAVFSIVNAFHNDELNINKAQLIFTTHNPVYQKAKIFRRDEIKFIERKDHTSKLYNLSDFKTSGKNQVKNTTDIMSNYLSGKYGAINYVDFSEVIHKALAANTEEGEE